MIEIDKFQLRLQEKLPRRLIVACSGTDVDPSLLYPDEWRCVSSAVPKRQREFAAGRATARCAMRILTGFESPLLSNEDRTPDWPAEMVGSISHTDSICISAVGLKKDWQSIGIDIEADDGIEDTLWDVICTPHELDSVIQLPVDERAVSVAKTFVAKEAFYKWYYPQRGVLLDFQDVSILWGENSFSFKFSDIDTIHTADVTRFEGLLMIMDGYLIGCCWSPSISH